LRPDQQVFDGWQNFFLDFVYFCVIIVMVPRTARGISYWQIDVKNEGWSSEFIENKREKEWSSEFIENKEVILYFL
jgi:hypothetical protein